MSALSKILALLRLNLSPQIVTRENALAVCLLMVAIALTGSSNSTTRGYLIEALRSPYAADLMVVLCCLFAIPLLFRRWKPTYYLILAMPLLFYCLQVVIATVSVPGRPLTPLVFTLIPVLLIIADVLERTRDIR